MCTQHILEKLNERQLDKRVSYELIIMFIFLSTLMEQTRSLSMKSMHYLCCYEILQKHTYVHVVILFHKVLLNNTFDTFLAFEF